MRQLFELCGEDRDICFSPYVWRIKLCLMHKGLDYETTPVRFLEKDGYEASGVKALPVLKDQDKWITESLEIARYLDDKYPDKPLFEGPQARAQASFLNIWLNKTMVTGIFPMIVLDIIKEQSDDCADYFRRTREKSLRCTVEEAQARRPDMLPKFQKSLDPMRAALKGQDFLSGSTPAWFDYAAFGTLMWPHVISDIELFEKDDSILEWQGRMMDLFGGYSKSVKTVHRSL